MMKYPPDHLLMYEYDAFCATSENYFLGLRNMRRKDREVRDIKQIIEIIDKCSVVHLGMVDDGMPYVVPLNFGYEQQGDSIVLYFHSASEGRKIDILKKEPRVFFQMEYSYGLNVGNADVPCTYSWDYECVMGSGRVEFIDDFLEKERAFNILLNHLGKTELQYNYPREMLTKTCVCRVCSSDIVGQRSG